MGDRERLPRKQRGRLRKLGEQEGELAARATFIADNLEKEQTLVFTYVLRSVAEDLDELKDRMSARRPVVDRGLIAMQSEVVRRLEALQGALKDELRRKREERERKDQQNQQQQNEQQPKNSNEGDQKRRLVPDDAELRMLKRLEIDARERIEEFRRLRNDLPQGFETWMRDSLQRLAHRHSKITDLLEKFLETRGLSGMLGEDDDAKKKDDSKGEGK